jgi:hypothetical protein
VAKNLKTACFLWVNKATRTSAQLGTDDWVTGTGEISTGTMLRGANHEVYLNALLQRGNATSSYTLAGGTTTTYPTVSLATTRAVIDFASMFDYAFLSNLPSASVVEAIKTRSRRKDGTKVGLWPVNVTAIPQKRYRNSVQDAVDGLAHDASTLVGTNIVSGADSRAANCTAVDPLQTNGSGGCSTVCATPDAGGGGVTDHQYSLNMANVRAIATASRAPNIMSSFVINGRYNAIAPTTVGAAKTHIDYLMLMACTPARTSGTAANYAGTATTTDANATTGYLANLKTHLAEFDAFGSGREGFKVVREWAGHGFAGDTILTGGTNGTWSNTTDAQARFHPFFFCSGQAPSATAETFDNIKAYCDAAVRGGYQNFLNATFNFQRLTSSDGTNFNDGVHNASELWAYCDAAADDFAQKPYGPGIISTVDYGDWQRFHRFLTAIRGVDANVIVNARTSNPSIVAGSDRQFGLMWQPEFGPVS